MENRILGRTGIRASVIGFGGIVVMGANAKDAANDVARAVDAGVNYFDVAPSYGDAECVLGPALAPYRDRVTLACKTAKRDAKGAREELENSLRQLKTDHFDVYQLHSVSETSDVEQVTAPGGALETLLRAREQGLVRYLGFSSHANAPALALLERFDFDSVLFPVNWGAWIKTGLGIPVLELAARRNMSRIAIKALAYGPKQGADGYDHCWYHPISDDIELAEMALRFTLSRDVCVAVSPGDARMLRLMLDILQKHGGKLPPLSEDELHALAARARGLDKSLFEQ